jgi:hypothetical protein
MRIGAPHRNGARRPWLVQLLARTATKHAAIALANKTARSNRYLRQMLVVGPMAPAFAARAHLVARGVRDSHFAVPYASYCLDKSEWSPEGDYLPEGDRLLMFKPEVHTAEWSVT